MRGMGGKIEGLSVNAKQNSFPFRQEELETYGGIIVIVNGNRLGVIAAVLLKPQRNAEYRKFVYRGIL